MKFNKQIKDSLLDHFEGGEGGEGDAEENEEEVNKQLEEGLGAINGTAKNAKRDVSENKSQPVQSSPLHPSDASLGLIISQGHYLFHFVFFLTITCGLVMKDEGPFYKMTQGDD
jgi:hypothetical protein